MDKSKIAIFDRILDEVISSTHGGLHWQVLTMYIFPNMTEIDAKAIIDEMQYIPDIKKYFRFYDAGDRITLGNTNDTNLLKHRGGFAYLFEKYEKEKQQQQPTTQHLTINAPVTGSQLGLSSDFGNLESSHGLTYTNNQDVTKQAINDLTSEQSKLNIWNKIYKWTDHKLISMIIYTLLGFLANQALHWFGWLPCP